MKVTLPELKNLIYYLVTFENDLKEDGTRVPRTLYPKKHLRGVKEIKESISAQLEVAVAPADKKREELKNEDITWVKLKDYKKESGNAIGERHTDAEIDFSNAAREAIKYYYEQADEITDISIPALDELETLLGLKAS